MDINDKRLESARQAAAATYSGLVDMVAALSVDYERLAELKDTDDDELTDDEREELAELIAAADECDNEDSARDRISEDALSVEIRSGWYTPGEEPEPDEFCILLCTGGPAIRIRGELDQYREPSRAWLEIQDWFTPWTECFSVPTENPDESRPVDSDVLLTYARQFYFGG